MRKLLYIFAILLPCLVTAWGQLDFDGSDDAVTCGSDSSLNFSSGGYTLAAWVNRDWTGVAEGFIMAKDGNVSDRGWVFGIKDNELYMETAGAIVLSAADMSTALTAGEWWHLCVTFDGSTYIGYVNGANDGSDTGASPGGTNPAQLMIGRREYPSFERWFDGKIAEPKIWSRCLTAAEVGELYRTGAYPTDTDTVVDWSGNGNTASVVGDPVLKQVGEEYVYNFGDDGDYLALDSTTFLNNSTAVTVIARVRLDAFANFDGIFFMKGSGTRVGGLRLDDSGNAELQFFIRDAAGNWSTSNPTNQLSIGVWHHIVGRWNNGSKQSEIFLDSVKLSSAGDSTNATIINIDSSWKVAWDENGVERVFQGDIDYVQVWDGVWLTDEQITNHYNGTAISPAPALNYNFTPARVAPVAEWGKADGLYAAGDTIVDMIDRSGNGYTATNFGATFATQGTETYGTFDGAADYMKVGDISSALDATDYYTIVARVRYTAGSGYGHVFRAENNSNPWNGRNIWVDLSDGEYGCYLFAVPRLASATLTAGSWHTIAITGYEHASAGYIKASLDGGAFETLLSSANTANLNVQAGTITTLGGNSSSEFFKGDIAYIEYFGNAFTDADISNRHFNATYTNAPLVDYRFNNDARIPNYGTAGSSADGVATNGVKVAASVPSVVYDDSVVVDWSGNGNNGTALGNSTLVYTDDFSYDFDATAGTYLSCTDIAATDGAANLTVMVEGYYDGVPGGDYWGVLVTKTSASKNEKWQMMSSGSGVGGRTNMLALLRNAGALYYGYTTGAGNLVPNEWATWTMVWDAGGATDADKLKIYKDGIQKPLTFSGTAPSTTSASNDGVVSLGAEESEFRRMNGKISECRIWTSSLTSNQVFAIESGTIPAGEVAIYTMTPPAQPSIKQRNRRQ